MKKVGKRGKQLRETEAEWAWRKQYRVWDANRKIFVYPENWIEPEPRLPTRFRASLGDVIAYIGETEKNLRCVFDAARKSRAVLFFDEADALFGEHTEVHDSHDRYANIEINYLLQRIEEYAGLAILATGKRTKIDNAFSRRFDFVIRVPPRRKPRRKQSSI